jgi:hypothetical protein
MRRTYKARYGPKGLLRRAIGLERQSGAGLLTLSVSYRTRHLPDYCTDRAGASALP